MKITAADFIKPVRDRLIDLVTVETGEEQLHKLMLKAPVLYLATEGGVQATLPNSEYKVFETLRILEDAYARFLVDLYPIIDEKLLPRTTLTTLKILARSGLDQLVHNLQPTLYEEYVLWKAKQSRDLS